MATSAKYAAAHANPAGEGDARPTAMAIVEDEQLLGQWTDKVVLVTGASNGIGVETARALYATGAHVFSAVRDVKKGEEVAADIRRALPDSKGRMDVLQLDLDSLQSVRDCAAAFLAKSKKLNVLICNAGVMATPEGKTKDGFETQLGTNHVAHFLLFQLLKPALLASSTSSLNSRVVTLTSSGHGFSPIHFGDYDLKQQGYDPWVAYGQSKTANIYMATEIERRYGSKGLHALAVHPGSITSGSGLQKHVTPESMKTISSRVDPTALGPQRYKSAAQGAATTLWAATAAEWEGKGGRFLEDCSDAAPRTNPKLMSGYAPHAYDVDAAKRLWADSCKWVGVQDEE